MRKLAGTLLAVAIALAGVVGMIAFFNARDDSTTGDQTKTTVTATGDGNVTVRYGTPRDGRIVRALAQELGAPDTPELRDAGLAVILERDPSVQGAVAEAGQEGLAVTDANDPALAEFIERWLGQAPPG